MTAEKSAHAVLAEAVVKASPPTLRKKLDVVEKSSYTVVSTDDGWIARLTPKVCEFPSCVDPTALDEHLPERVKNEWHRKHAGEESVAGLAAALGVAVKVKPTK